MEDLFAANPRNLKLPTTDPALLPVCPSSIRNGGPSLATTRLSGRISVPIATRRRHSLRLVPAIAQNRTVLPRAFSDEVFGTETKTCPRFVDRNLGDAVKPTSEDWFPPAISREVGLQRT